jgi:hypothetical protein
VPAQQGFGCDDPALPLSAGEGCGDGSAQSPVVIVEYRSVDLSAQHGVLMPKHDDLEVLRASSADGETRQTGQEAVQDAKHDGPGWRHRSWSAPTRHFPVTTARNTIATDPQGADALLQGLRADAAAAVREIRRLVYDMRPPALDELGLVEALRQQLATTCTPTGHPMRVSMEADKLPALAASVEVAAYRIATEAVTNSARHSGTDRVQLAIGHARNQLVIAVRDAGSSGSKWVPGVGLSSMQERAAEIGGSVTINANVEGAEVVARLPLDPHPRMSSTGAGGAGNADSQPVR